jgi:hypothetical protein
MAKNRKRQDPAASSDNASTATMERPSPTNGGSSRDRIAQRAYELYLARGRTDGSDWEDWLLAEREVLGGSSAESEG